MRLALVCVGTRGDVQPYVALGGGFRAAGHRVRVVADPVFAPLVQQAGLEFYPVRTDPQQLLQEGVGRVGLHPLCLQRWLLHRARGMARAYFADVAAACRDVDGILFSALAFPAAHVAEAQGIPYVGAYLQPLTPTRAFPGPFALGLLGLPAWFPFRGLLNRLSFRLANAAFSLLIHATVNRCRRELLGLPPKPLRFYLTVDVQPIPILYGFSPHVVPRPPDWGPHIHVTGYWPLTEPAWKPPPGLVAFLEAGPPPVYVGFGSMVDMTPERLTHMVVEALAVTGRRGILLGGWARLGRANLPPTILQVDQVPHGWLFPRCAAVVHHGGAGTTAAGLRAGVPNVVVPFTMDQPFWAWRVHALGVGPRPIPRSRLSAARLAQAIQEALTRAEMSAKAAALGERLRNEDGLATAVRVGLRYLR